VFFSIKTKNLNAEYSQYFRKNNFFNHGVISETCVENIYRTKYKWPILIKYKIRMIEKSTFCWSTTLL